MLSEAADCRRQETSGGSGDGSGFLDHHGAPCSGRQRYTQLRQNRCPGQEPVEFWASRSLVPPPIRRGVGQTLIVTRGV